MTIKQLKEALLGKYLHFTAEYKSEDTVWGGVIKKVESGGHLLLNTYFKDDFFPRTSYMFTNKEQLEELVTHGYLKEHDLNIEPESAVRFNGITDIIYTQLLDNIPKDGDKRLVVIRYPLGFGAKFSKMYYTIGDGAEQCSKCSLNQHNCKEYCKKYRCSYLEKYELNTKRL